MESVRKARQRMAALPKLVTKCSVEASAYAKCISAKEDVKLNDCAKQFEAFRTCVEKQAKSFK